MGYVLEWLAVRDVSRLVALSTLVIVWLAGFLTGWLLRR